MINRKKRINPALGYTSVFLLTGLALLLGGIYLTKHFLETIKEGAVYIFVFFLPVPMILFGTYAVITAFSQEKPATTSKTDDTFLAGPSNQEAIKSVDVAISLGETESNNVQLQNKTPSTGSMFLYLFIIFGIVIMLVIAFASAAIDINKGITHSCSRATSCYDVYLNESATRFYITLALNAFKLLIIPGILIFFVKKWFDE